MVMMIRVDRQVISGYVTASFSHARFLMIYQSSYDGDGDGSMWLINRLVINILRCRFCI